MHRLFFFLYPFCVVMRWKLGCICFTWMSATHVTLQFELVWCVSKRLVSFFLICLVSCDGVTLWSFFSFLVGKGCWLHLCEAQTQILKCSFVTCEMPRTQRSGIWGMWFSRSFWWWIHELFGIGQLKWSWSALLLVWSISMMWLFWRCSILAKYLNCCADDDTKGTSLLQLEVW